MNRTSDSSKWFVPLVAGVELVKQTPGLRQAPITLVGNLPVVQAVWPGTLLWVDAASTSSTKTTRRSSNDWVYQWMDRSGNGRHLYQNIYLRQPRIDTLGSYEGVRFED